MRLRSEDKHHVRKSADRKAQITKAFVPLTGLICAFRSADFLRWCLSSERNLTHNLFFLSPIVFGINLIHFSMRRRLVQPEIRSFFGASIPCHAICQKQNEEREQFRRAQRFWQRKVWSQRPSRGEKLRCKLLAWKSAKLFANTKVEIFGKERCKIHLQFQRFGKERCKIHRQVQRYKRDVTSVSLSLSLSLCISLSLSLSLTERTSRPI